MVNPLFLLFKLVAIFLALIFGLVFVSIALGAAHHYINRYGDEVVWSIVKAPSSFAARRSSAGGGIDDKNVPGWRRRFRALIRRCERYNPSLVTIARRRRPILLVLGMLGLVLGWLFVNRTLRAVKEVSAELESIRSADWTTVGIGLPVVEPWRKPQPQTATVAEDAAAIDTGTMIKTEDAAETEWRYQPPYVASDKKVPAEATVAAVASIPLSIQLSELVANRWQDTIRPALLAFAEGTRQTSLVYYQQLEAFVSPYVIRLHNASPEARLLSAILGLLAAYGLLRILSAAFRAVFDSSSSDGRKDKRKRKPIVERPHLRRANEPLDDEEAEEIVAEVNRMVLIHSAVEEALKEARDAEEKERKQRAEQQQQQQQQQQSRRRESLQQGQGGADRTPVAAGGGRAAATPDSAAGGGGAFFSPPAFADAEGVGEDSEAARKRAEAKKQARIALLLDIAESSGLPANNEVLLSLARPLLAKVQGEQ